MRKNLAFHLAIVLFIYGVVYGVLIASTWMEASLVREQEQLRLVLSEEEATRVIDRADGWFSVLFVDTGIVDHSFKLFLPTQENATPKHWPEKLGAWLTLVWDERMRVFWGVVFQSLIRLSSAMMWLPFAALLMAPFIVDGLVSRKIKQTNFDQASGILHRYSLWLIHGLVILFIVLAFLPVPMNPYLAPAFMVTVAAASGVFCANIQKRI